MQKFISQIPIYYSVRINQKNSFASQLFIRRNFFNLLPCTLKTSQHDPEVIQIHTEIRGRSLTQEMIRDTMATKDKHLIHSI